MIFARSLGVTKIVGVLGDLTSPQTLDSPTSGFRMMMLFIGQHDQLEHVAMAREMRWLNRDIT
jgi:hypothetical protein